MSTMADVLAKHDEVLRLAAEHGATCLRIIGSTARGEARPDSDIDLLVTWREDTSPESVRSLRNSRGRSSTPPVLAIINASAASDASL